MKYTDTVLLDLKQIDEDKHIKLTGKTNENILEMFNFLTKIKKPVWVRYVLVPGWTDAEEDLKGASAFLRKMKNVKRIDVLPYHTLGVHKWIECKMKYKLGDIVPPTDEEIKIANNILIK